MEIIRELVEWCEIVHLGAVAIFCLVLNEGCLSWRSAHSKLPGRPAHADYAITLLPCTHCPALCTHYSVSQDRRVHSPYSGHTCGCGSVSMHKNAGMSTRVLTSWRAFLHRAQRQN